jgi:hypothetical protein
VEIEIFGEWVEGEVAAEPLSIPGAIASGLDLESCGGNAHGVPSATEES